MAKKKDARLAGLAQLTRGLQQFQQQVVGKDADFYAQLVEGQQPQAMFITCSDSRIDPNLMTQTGPGDLFVLRNAGTLVPRYDAKHVGAEAATIEYAVRVLKVQHIVVCGHTHCGAMAALAKAQDLTALPAVAGWLEHAQPRRLAKMVDGALAGNDRLDAYVAANVVVQLENLATHPCVREAADAGNLHLHGWVYSIDTGGVQDYDLDTKKFLPKLAGWGQEGYDGAAAPPVKAPRGPGQR